MVGSKKFWVGIIFSALLLALFLLTGEPTRMLKALVQANYIFLIPGIGLYLVSVLFRTLRWRILLHHIKPIGIKRLYPVVVVGYMANNLLPMRLGEIVRSYYVGEREGISKTSALVTIFIERILDALTLLFFISIIVPFVSLTGLVKAFGETSGIAGPLLVAALTVPFITAFAVLVLFAAFPARARAFALAIARPLPTRFEQTLHHLIDMFLQGLIPLRSPGTLALLFLVSIPIWLLETSLFIFTGFAFGLQNVYQNLVDMSVAMILVTSIANIGSSIPAAPGGIGLFEWITRESLTLLPLQPVDRAVAGAFAAVVHAALLIPMIVLGQIFLWTAHLSLRKLSQRGQDGESEPVAIAQSETRASSPKFGS